MNRDQAKEILHGYRPGGGDASDPFFAEALEMTKHDPELGRWFAEQQALDGSVARALREQRAPESLRAQILAQPANRRWWNPSMRPTELALAASIVLLVALGGFWMQARQEQFSKLRDDVIERTWDGKRHVDLETSNLAEIRRFIAAHHISGDFKLPPELAAMPVRGCSLLNVDEHTVPYICFAGNNKHIHLAIMDKTVCPHPPVGGTPDFTTWNKWATTTWSQGGNTFVLTGVRPLDFVKKFRKDRQWTWGG